MGSFGELCTGFPPAFQTYMEETQKLSYEARPDYVRLRRLLREAREQLGDQEYRGFEWLKDQDVGELEPLKNRRPLRMPDDMVAAKSPNFLRTFADGRRRWAK